MKKLFLILFLSINIGAFAQNYKFGKVSKDELQERFNPLDSSASATCLYKYRKSYFNYDAEKGFMLVTEVHERIKIYSTEGFDYATKSISVYSDQPKEKLTGLKAYTYNLVNNKIEDTKLGKDGIFKTELSKFYDQTKFTMPNLKVGSVIEYRYKLESPFYWNVDEFIFQKKIPIKKLVAKFEAPEYFNYKVNHKGYMSVIPTKDKKSKKIVVKSESLPQPGGHIERYENDVEYEIHVSNYDLSNIPALKDEPFVNNINNYRSSVRYELSYTKFPQSSIKYYSTTWEDVVKTIYKSSNFGDQLDKTGYFESDIDALIGGVSDPTQRMSLIFDHVKSKVKWNGYSGKYTTDGVRKAYKEQVGNVAEINLMLTSMLRYAGLKANPVLVSTRNNGVPLFPTREGYNYVISCIEIPNGVILFDATSKYSAPNVLPFRVLNWEGRIIRERGSSALISLYPSKKSANSVVMMVNLEDNGDIKGSIRTTKTNHKALSYREIYIESDKDQFLEDLENKYNGMEVSDFVVKNDLDLSKPVMETYKFILESQADVINDKIFVSPLMFLRTSENPFKLEKREFPVDFGYPTTSKYRVIVNIPEGYKIESVPESKVLKLPDNLGMFKYNISATDTAIQLVVDRQINESIIVPLYYDVIKEYFNQMIEKENEKVVLSRKSKP